MGGIAAALSKGGEDAVSSVLLMLQKLEHRGADTIRVATPITAVSAKSLQELRDKRIFSSIAVGHSVSHALREEGKPTVLRREYALAFEGHLCPSSKASDTNESVDELGSEPERSAERFIKEFDGSYIFAIPLSNRLVAGRDLFGTSPLFFGENQAFCTLASERKALWALGIKHAKSFPPGNLATATLKGFTFKPVATVPQPIPKRIGMEKAAHRLRDLLLASAKERVSDAEKIAVAFSGGLDSSVVAVLAKACAKRVNLVTVGLGGQPELRHAEVAAKSLELPLQVQAFTVADVESTVEKVLWLIEEPDAMKVGVAIPLFWAAHIASKIGCRVLLTGQGADELFGGYHKYLNEYKQGGVEAVQKSMHHDLVMSYETNSQRDNPVCAFHKLELRLPFIDREVVRFALSLPLKLKIESAEDGLRKRVLRRAAQDMGIPTFITEKTKKAVQYATGVDRALRELARRRGLTKRDYVKRVFEKIYPTVEDE